MNDARATFTVKQLAGMAGVSPRTLRFYDQIGLLRPETVGQNGYRYYGQNDLLRLQQILLFRELGFSLDQIKTILDRPDFDLLAALESHRRALLERADRVRRLVDTVDHTIRHIRGEIPMSQKDFYAGFDEEQQRRRAEEAARRWGEPAVTSQKRWESLNRDQKNDILAQMNAISEGVAAHMDEGPASPEVQAWVERWYRHINDHFYDCSLEMFAGLGEMYVEDPAFTATYEAIRPGMAAFMQQAMQVYVEDHS
jgi:DNA-binding transcriptional MerR regulator